MGGKHKQAQRTKNNARPSSSGRSAELLGNSTPAFVGFTAVKDGGFAPVLPGFSVTAPEELDPNLNPNFHLVLKKMGKKDSTTKLKALQEFSELIRNSEPEAVKAVLPLWPRLYCHLAVDVEHRVREATHQALRAVVLRAKRNLAPYLRQLAGAWFTSQYDTYPPAATAASLAFQEAFPPNKVTEAIIFCQEEILNYICDNLLVQTPQTLSNPKVMTAEEMEAKYLRLIVSSLQGYVLYLEKLPAEQLEAAQQANKKLITSKKFWKFSKHASPLVRNAWFSVLIALCQHAPVLLADEGSHVALAVFNNLDETDPAVLPTVWDAALHILTTIQDCWQYVSAEKLVLPKLWHILRDGGQGNAATIFPNLLPFLSKIPPTISSNKQEFYDKFFDNIRYGMSQKSVLQSTSECQAISKCYIECLRYIVMLHISDAVFCEAIVQNHLVSAVSLMLKDQKFHLVSTSLFPQVSSLISYWSKSEEYTVLVKLFWNCLTSSLLECLTTGSNETDIQSRFVSEWLLSRQVELCQNLKNPNIRRCSRKLKVKFSSSETSSESGSPDPESPEDDKLSMFENIEIDNNLQTMIHVISATYMKKIKELSDQLSLIYLAKLTKSFGSKELFFNLLTVNSTDEVQLDSKESLVKLYDSVLYKWLQDDTLCTENVVSITFVLFKFLTSEEKSQVLDSLCKVQDGSVLVWCVKSSLEQQSDPSIQKWLQSNQLSQILVSMAREVCSKKTATDAKHVLKYCLTNTREGEFVISESAFSDILFEFCGALSSPCEEYHYVDFLTELVKLLYSKDLRLNSSLHSNKAAEKLLLSLFKLSCKNSNRSKEDIKSAWCIAISALARFHGSCSEDFLKISVTFAQVVNEELLARSDMSLASIDHIVTTVISFIHASVSCFPTNIDDEPSYISAAVKLCSIFLMCGSLKLNSKEHKLTALCLYAEQLKGLLSFNSKTPSRPRNLDFHLEGNWQEVIQLSDNEETSNLEVDVHEYVTLLLYSVTLISKLPDVWNKLETEEVESNSDQENIDRLPHKLSVDNAHLLEDHILTALYSLSLCESFTSHYKSSIYCYKMSSRYDVLQERFKLLIDIFDSEAIENFTISTEKRALQHGNIWLQTVHLLHKEILNQTDVHKLYLNLTSKEETQNFETLHRSQTFSQFLTVDDLKTSVTELDVEKLTMVTFWLNKLEGTVPEEFVNSIINFLNSVLIWYQLDDKKELLFDCKIKWPKTKEVAAIARFLAAVIEKCPEILTSDLWDAIIISLASWILTVNNSQDLLLIELENDSPCLMAVSTNETLSTVRQRKYKHPEPLVNNKLSELNMIQCYSLENHCGAVFAIAIFKLFKALSDFFSKSRTDGYSGDVKKFHEKLSEEWKDVFADDVQGSLVRIFYMVSDSIDASSLSILNLPLLESFGEAMLAMDPKLFFSSGKVSLDEMLQCCCRLIRSSVILLQVTAYHILTSLTHGLIELDTPVAFAAAAVDKLSDSLSLLQLQETLQETQTIVDTMLMGIRMGNSCTVCPFTDAYTYSMAYLLLWSVILEMCGLAISELRYQYATILRDSGFLKNLLDNVFRLMPEQVLQTTNPKFKMQKITEMFASAPALTFSQDCKSELLEHLSCWVYCNTLRRLPALVRQWWGDAEPRVASLVEQVTSTHCTSLLCNEEMKAIQGKDMHHGNVLVKVHPSVREVVAVYKVDEARMELSIQLPSNYPLGPVHVESGKQLVDSGQWRNWMMQLTVFLTHQNGSIWDGLTLWKSNLDKRFEGVEECYICFSILHGSNFQIPRQCCSTCKKKFHSPCLYKWFNTSNKATCPICRNLF